MSDKFYTSRRWRTLRAKRLRMDDYLCQDCLKYFRSRPAATVHHVKPREEYPKLQWDIDNLVSLCADCHNKRHPEKGRWPQGSPHPLPP